MLTRVRELMSRGVIVPHPESVLIGEDVDPDRIESGAEIHPFARIHGRLTMIGRESRIGCDGPATVRDAAVGRNVTLASGTFENCVLLDGSSYGPSGYARAGTLFEEGASAAHATGTKQAILLPWAALGSNVNFCDALLAGGTSRKDHSEAGSGFIHFNFTPYGPAGDKATPSCFGDVVAGVWLRERRIFLGGAGGVVGPVRIGFGTVLAAGSVFRKDRDGDLLVYGESLPPVSRAFDPAIIRHAVRRVAKNLAYMAELVALRAVYAGLRLPLAGGDSFRVALVRAGIDLIGGALEERVAQISRLLSGLEAAIPSLESREGRSSAEAAGARAMLAAWPGAVEGLLPPSNGASPSAPPPAEVAASFAPGAGSFPEVVARMSPAAVASGRRWLAGIAAEYLGAPGGAGRLLPGTERR